jgi:cephalosporin hydroxylase
MFPFWDPAIAPVLEAAGVRRLVEIGALRGENTRQIIERLGPETELHVIDPVPDFDPTEHERRFAGQYVFHRDLSVNVLGSLPPMDAALIDGDHNWYTVLEELRLLAKVAADHDAPFPVMVLHDVLWPYGRRDLYYDPATVPVEHQQPHRQAGIRPGQSELIDGGGLNPWHWNAETEGGPRNGVMTAVEDFIAEHPEPLRLVVLPLYYGLAILVDEARLARQPEIGRVLDHLESAEGRRELIELGESIRLRSMVTQHAVLTKRDATIDHLRTRYLDGVVAALVNEHYLENEVRMVHLHRVATGEGTYNADLLRDPVRSAPVAFAKLRSRRRLGTRPGERERSTDFALAPGRLGLDALGDLLGPRVHDGVAGDIAVCGVGRGGTGIYARAWLEAHEVTDRKVWLADRFRADEVADLNAVRDSFDRFGLLDDQLRFLQGDPAATLAAAEPAALCLVVVGFGATADVRASLDHLYPRLSVGGVVVVDDADDPEVRAAIEGFRSANGITASARRLPGGSLAWTREVAPAGPDLVAARPAEPGTANVPLAPGAEPDLDLSVVIVFYNMKREAARSLHALSRSYQVGIDDLSYEVIVVENGSKPDQRLGAEMVESFGPEFRYLDLGEEATPTPADALNRGIALTRGRAVALMIDGAHVLTPGVLHYAMVGLEAYDPAVVAVQAWYVGPGQQGEAMRAGYDQAAEDKLFDRIGWPQQGYRIFEIGHIIGDRDWLEGLWESNCLFVRRSQLEQVGGFDEAFAMPGGGYTNLEAYERLGAAPDVQLVTVLGEASFHQVHGGTTTNLTDPLERRSTVRGYFDHHTELRGRKFIGPEKPIRFVGAFETQESKRTRARRITGQAFDVDPELEGEDGPLGAPQPLPEDLRDTFTRAYWRAQAWRSTSWLGHPLDNAVTDLVTYQEIVTDVRPDWIVEVGAATTGRTAFLASVLDGLGTGQIVTVTALPPDERFEHPRVTYVDDQRTSAANAEAVRAVTGAHPHGLVIIGTRTRRDAVRRDFDAFADLVGQGSYLIMEHTMLNGWPVDASHGRGPFEAVRGILATRDDFVVDFEREKQALTFNPYGFLRRIK